VGQHERTVRAGARDIFLTEATPDAGQHQRDVPLVLLHGGGPGATGTGNYARNIDVFAAAGYRVLVPDLPGYGRSAKDIDQSDPFGDLAVFVRALLDALDIDRAYLAGNSYGGAAALRLALDRPDRVARLVLMGPGGIGTTRALPTKGLSALLSYYAGDGPSRDKLRTFVRGALRTLCRMDFTRDRARLARCPVPTLVIWGTEDKVNRPSGGPYLAATMPDCDLHLFARTGHWAQYEQAARFNRLVLDWLADGAS
jgi:4,5:9,10-diseco-3-hydroxy-5,9,17-trioxoandrosta-1(10),2-diene-4-oate hydrolase